MWFLRIKIWLCLINICIGSYLDFPRIHFSGRYLANVNSVNNDPSNFKLSLPQESIKPGWNSAGGNEWSLRGCTVTSVVYINGTTNSNAHLEPLIGAAIESNPYSVEGKMATFDVNAWNKSTLFGVTLRVKQSPNSDKFGFIGSLLPNSVAHQNCWYQVPCTLSHSSRDVYGAKSVSKLTNVNWANVLGSEVLQQLKEISGKHGGQLSISLVMYDFSFNATAANFTYGRISGSIGYGQPSEPRFFEGERLLSFEFVAQPNLTLSEDDPCFRKTYTPIWAYRAPFKVHYHTKTLTVDFSSSFTRDSNRAIRDLGILYLGILTTNDQRNLCVEIISSIDYQDDRCRNINGCIMDFKLSDYHFSLTQNYRLVIVKPLEDFPPTNTTYPLCQTPHPHFLNRLFTYDDHSMVAIMIEQWYFMRPHNYYTFVLEKGGVAIVDLFVTVLSQPAFGRTIQVMPSVSWIKPANGISFNHEATVDQYGYARFMFRANSIKYYPRQENNLDGQLYQFIYYVKGEPQFCATDIKLSSSEDHTCIEMLTIKVYSDIFYDNIETFTWVDHVQPIFLLYSRIYSIMKNAIDLASYNDVTQSYAIHLLNYSMQLDINHPNYMPVSRDLSSAKKKMILEWLTKPCYNSTHCLIRPEVVDRSNDSTSTRLTLNHNMHETTACNNVNSFHEQPQDPNKFYTGVAKPEANDQTVDCIKELKQSGCSVYVIQYCLQKTIELEFYTIPLYLTALYTLKDNYNTEVKTIIRNIVMQEMLHMLQASNLLISIGGRPIIDSASTAPAYPATGLPGGVFPHLTVSLKKASLDQIYSVFMAIEYPHEVIDSELGIDIVQTKTIGQLYTEINKCLSFHGDTLFYPNRTSLQVKWPYTNDYGKIYIVHNLATAMNAIKEITEQGEGAQPGDPRSFDRNDLAHFFKFQEIVCGRQLVFHDVSNYTYTGDQIKFDESKVWPMRDNPSMIGLTPGTQAYTKSKIFHETYRSLLRTLDSIFAGHPDELSETVAIMESIDVQAKVLMSFPLNEFDPNGETCGPIFEYYWY